MKIIVLIVALTFLAISVLTSSKEQSTLKDLINLYNGEVEPTAAGYTVQPTYQINSDGSTTHIMAAIVCSQEVPQEARGHNCFHGKSIISFYAHGENFVAIDDDSLEVATFKVNGVDRRLNRQGDSPLSIGYQTNVSNDARYLSWNLEIEDEFTSFSDIVEVDASVSAVTSKNLATAYSRPINLQSFTSQTLGEHKLIGTEPSAEEIESKLLNVELTEEQKTNLPLALKEISKLGPNSNKDEIEQVLNEFSLNIEQVGSVLMESMSSMFGASNSSPRDSITLTGDLNTIQKIEIIDGDKTLESNSYSTSAGQRTYYFPQTSGNDIIVRMHYWENPQTITLNMQF